MMRKMSTLLAVAGLAVLGLSAVLPGVATAAPEVKFKAVPVPVPIEPANPHSKTYPHTGYILGAGAAIEAEFTIHGTEYATEYGVGSPSPLVGVKVYLPKGTTLHPQGFATCSKAILESEGPKGCSKKSYAGPVGEARGHLSFGSTRVEETLTVQPYFRAGGGLVFFAYGKSPAVVELYPEGTLSPTGGPFSDVFTTNVPLVEGLPGQPDGSAEFIKVKVGAARKQGKKLISYGTVPKTCPKGSLEIKAELTFLSGETVTVSYKAPCPKHKK
jgi:hypothetical protein